MEIANFSSSKFNKINSKVQISILLLTTTLINFWNIFPIFKGRIFGDPFDARLQIVLHEHWWRWLNGLVEFRDTEFFYPFKLGLGFSDNFLFQGLIHSFFRSLDFSILNSWILTNIIILFIGNLGWVFLARNIFKNFLNSFLFIMSMNLNIQFINYFVFQVNTVGYLLISWILFFSTLRIKKRILKFYILFTSLAIYALLSWYAFFFLLLFSIVLFFIQLNNKKFREEIFKYIYSIKNSIKFFEILIFSLFNGALISIFAYIYFPVKDAPSRSVDELIYGSLELKNIFDNPIYIIQNLSQVDDLISKDIKQNGLNIFLVITLIAVIFFKFKFKNVISFEIKVIISCLIMLFYFINFGSSFILHKYFYLYVPGFDSLRYTHRSVIFLTQILIIILFIILDKKYQKFRRKDMIFIYAILLPIFVTSQIHPQWNGWSKETLVNQDLKWQTNDIKAKCDYFYFDAPGGWWYDQVEAMYFAYEIGMPTVNGYSGGFPVGYPNLDFNEMNESQQIFTWISGITKTKRGCYLTGKTPLYELNSSVNRIDPVGLIEKSKNLYYSTSAYPYIYLFTNLNKDYNFTLNVKNSECNFENELSYKLGENTQYSKIKLNDKDQEIIIKIKAQNSRVHRIIFSSNSEKCLLENKENYFYLSDFKLNTN